MNRRTAVSMSLAVAMACIPAHLVACGWWGDAEHGDEVAVQVVDARGRAGATADPSSSPGEMVRTGDRFRSGKGAPRDLALARHWYHRAAVLGHPGGQYNLARMHELGLGVPRDDTLAATWYLQAARQGEVHSQHHLGAMYREGRGLERDLAESLHWFGAAADQRHGEVFPELAVAHERGLGTPRDLRRAYFWWRLAERDGNPSAPARCAALRRELGALAVAEVEVEVLAFTPREAGR